ncbi:DUF3843 family protein [Flavobacterium sp.]|uniref:DUF3843 family protein n=1 Tax=Flavobacterium sp. TaxID=239 RepID=UPI0037516AF9
MKINKIVIKDWLNFKPYNSHSKVDIQFLAVANQLNTVLQEISFLKSELGYVETDLKELSIFLTCYLEDLVSDTNIWNTFISIHKEQYKKELPFYNLKYYTTGEVNKVDIQFLIWYFFNLKMPERFLSPYDEYLDIIAIQVFEILDYEYEYVEENYQLNNYFAFNDNSDYYETRRHIQKILFESYLFKIDAEKKLKQEIAKNLKDITNDDTFKTRIINSVTDELTISNCTKLLALTGKEWLAENLGKKNKLYTTIKNTSKKISSWFLYKGENEKYYHFQHIASDVLFNLTKESFSVKYELSDDYIYYIEMINWNNEWTFSGITFNKKFDANLILDEKNDMVNIRIGNQFRKNEKEKIANVLKNQQTIFIKLFKSLIVFVSGDNLQATLDSFMNYHNTSLSKSEEEAQNKKNESKKNLIKKGYFGEDNNLGNIQNGNFVIFFNPISGIELYNNICDIFPDKENPFYKGENVNNIKMFLFNDQYSKEISNYFIDNYARKLDFFKNGTGKKYLSDFDFLLRFWKTNKYNAEPTITLI